MAKNHSDEEVETCVWCRPGSASLKPDADNQQNEARPEKTTHIATTARKKPSEEIVWISCTRCRMWYHPDCVALQELVSKVLPPSSAQSGQDIAAPDPFPTPGSSGSLPPEVITELRNHGMTWDWTGAVDKWSVPAHVAFGLLTKQSHCVPLPPSSHSRTGIARHASLKLTKPKREYPVPPSKKATLFPPHKRIPRSITRKTMHSRVRNPVKQGRKRKIRQDRSERQRCKGRIITRSIIIFRRRRPSGSR